MTIVHIKNMVCPRCITAVRAILVSMGATVESVTLGEAVINENLNEEQFKVLTDKLMDEGFELLDDPRSCLVEQVRIGVMNWVMPPLPPYRADFTAWTEISAGSV